MMSPGTASKQAFTELKIQGPDGKTRPIPLDRPRITIGRASTNELCYPEDAGLSRQHLSIERSGDGWVVTDLGSKNGTFVNGMRLSAPHQLRPEDRVTAGHLVIETADRVPAMDKTVVFIDPAQAPSSASTVISLDGVLAKDKGFEAAAHMRALVRAGRELSENLPLPKLFELILELSIEAVGAARGVLMTLENEELVLRAAKGEGLRMSGAVRDRVLTDRQSWLVRDARLDEALAGRMSIVEQQIRSMIAVPLQTEERVIGLIYLDSPFFVREFTAEDLELLTVMAAIAAVRIERVRLAEVEQAERIMAKDLQQAAEIQRGLLPSEAPKVEGFDIAGFNLPCRTVGGDYYDFIPSADGRIAILVADVAGKGMPAAMLMSNLQARAQVLFEDPTDLASLVVRLNRVLRANCPSNRFITFFVGVLEPATGELTYVNAGHNPPLLVRSDNSIETLPATGLILGILPAAQYEQKTCTLRPGELLVLFSDGVTEASKPTVDEEYGEDRLADAVKAMRGKPSKEIIDAIQAQVFSFLAGYPAADDITLIVAQRTP
ncbi:MAG TPA: SpoIIE family protein phosphatase [Bryobacteraceae bacterium]|nr:SpoIIE family protein phosphatase [Bryobacteraceae bacterium]